MPVEDGTGGLVVVESDDEHVSATIDEVGPGVLVMVPQQRLQGEQVKTRQASRSGLGNDVGELRGEGHFGLLSLRTATTLQRGMTNTPVASPASLSD